MRKITKGFSVKVKADIATASCTVAFLSMNETVAQA